jgi:hypothetical protein
MPILKRTPIYAITALVIACVMQLIGGSTLGSFLAYWAAIFTALLIYAYKRYYWPSAEER